MWSPTNKQCLLHRWFFLRYTDPQPHLRLRIHTSASKQIPIALHMLLSWSRELVTRELIQRFALDTYEREVARYGGLTSIDLLEQVFHFDSDLCSNLIAAHYTHRLILNSLTVAVVSLDRLFTAWGYDLNRRQNIYLARQVKPIVCPSCTLYLQCFLGLRIDIIDDKVIAGLQ